MSRPASMKVDGTVYWTLMTYDADGILVDADSTPTVAVRKNGASVADVVTVTKRAATTGIYDCSYNPAGEAEGDCFTIEETATLSSQAYENAWSIEAQAAERGTDGASTFDSSTDEVITDAASRNASKADVSALATQASVDSIDTGVQAIGSDVTNILADTNDLQLNQNNWLTATGFSTHSAGDVAAAVLVTPANKLATDASGNVEANNMRGTDGANTVAPDNATISTINTNVGNIDTVVDLIKVDTTGLVSSVAALNDLSALDVENAVWDASVSGHNAAGSTGKFIRVLKEGTISIEGAVNDASATATTFSTDLTNASTSFYHNKLLVFISGQNAGQTRHIDSYDGTTKEIVVSENFSFAPANGDEFLILASHEYSNTERASEVVTQMQSVASDFKADVSGLATQASIDALNDFNPNTDPVANVVLVDTTTNLTNGGNDCPTAQEIVDAWGNQPQGVYTTPDTLGFYLDAQVSSAGSGGTGLYQATVRVQDSNGDALQGARINVDGTTLTLTTDSSGEVTFNLDSGVYLLEVSPPAGYDTPVGQVLTIAASDPADTVFTLASTTPPEGCNPPWIG